MKENGKSTPEWLREIIRRFEAVDSLLPEPAWLKGDWPTWVQNVARELGKTLFPTARLAVGRTLEIGEVASVIGQRVAYLASLGEVLNQSEKKTPPEVSEFLRKNFDPDIEQKQRLFLRKVREEFRPQFDAAVKFALATAYEQDHLSQTKFFAAFTKALQRKPRLSGDIGNTATPIYLILLLSWRRVEEFGSIPELHRRLRQCAFLGSQVVGNLKHIEKICERVGLSYREIASRKQRATIPDMSGVSVSGDKKASVRVESAHGDSRAEKKRRAKTGAHAKRSGALVRR